MARFLHVGADAFLAQRDNLLARYDNAKRQASDDPVKTEHGVVGEAIVREFLQEFLPKKFGVTKGYIITHNLQYEGPIEEWDIIIYDKLESPVLFVRDAPESTKPGQRLAIPVEHVRGVVEVKATFRPDMAKRMCEKLLKLKSFVGVEESAAYPKFLKNPFVCTGIFFETDVANPSEFRAALDQLISLTPGGDAPSLGFLILRSQNAPDHGAYLRHLRSETSIPSMGDDCSTEFSFPDGSYGRLSCFGGWGVNYFPWFMFDLVASLMGNLNPGMLSSFYGFHLGAPSSNLFPTDPKADGAPTTD